MMYKNLCSTILAWCFIVTLASAQTTTTTASLQAVTVYATAAELNHTAKANIPSGTSEIVIKNISSSVDENSIQVGADIDLTIMSVSFRKEYLSNKPKSSALQKVEDSLKLANTNLEILKNQIETQKNARSILDANKVVRGENTGLNVAELTKMVDYYIAKHKEITVAIQELTEKEKKQTELVNNLNAQKYTLTETQDNTKGEIVLQVMANTSANAIINLSYLTYTAAWSPVYDIKTKDLKSNLKLLYKGNIVQNTGLDWNKIKLTLSTSNPSQNGQAPILSAWFLNYYQPQYANANAMANDYQAKKPMAKISGGRAENTQYLIDGQMAQTQNTSVDKFTTITETALNATFDIDLLYDIPSDNKAHSVAMKDYDLPATYKYYSAPRVDKDAFLLAEVSEWEQLNLLAGPSNIIFDGTYIGKSYIDPNSTLDTINFSLGRDKKIIIKREKLKDFSSSKFIGSNKLQTITYEIKIKNTRKENINLTLKDQYPLSTNKDIEIELLESSNAYVNKDNGVLTWDLNLAPGETKKLRLSYSVKFPKDKSIGNLY